MTGKRGRRTDIGLLLLRYRYKSKIWYQLHLQLIQTLIIQLWLLHVWHTHSISRFLFLCCILVIGLFWTKWELRGGDCQCYPLLYCQTIWLKISDRQVLKSSEYIHATRTAVVQLYVEETTGTVSSISVAMKKDLTYCLMWLLNVLVLGCYHADGTQLMTASRLYSSFT